MSWVEFCEVCCGVACGCGADYLQRLGGGAVLVAVALEVCGEWLAGAIVEAVPVKQVDQREGGEAVPQAAAGGVYRVGKRLVQRAAGLGVGGCSANESGQQEQDGEVSFHGQALAAAVSARYSMARR